MEEHVRRSKPRGDRVKGLVRLRGAAVLAVVPLAALTYAAPLSLSPAPLPSTAAHAEQPVPDPDTPAAPTNSAFEARTAPAAFRSAAPTSDLPGSAYAAYQRAEAVINASSTGCNLPWELLAAVGQVETDHGRRTPPKVTPTADSDGGLYDGSAAGDIPVGPLQLTPQAWAAVGVDADGDGNRDAEDIDDAALGLAVLLCSAKEDLATQAGQRAALSQHNQDPGYLDLVLRLADAYTLPVSISARMATPTMVSPKAEQAKVKSRANGKSGGGNSSFEAKIPGGGGAVASALDSTPKPTTPPPTSRPTPRRPPSRRHLRPASPRRTSRARRSRARKRPRSPARKSRLSPPTRA
ncbi:hypothetical protein [Nocardioides alcanivorans]|uniref:hypothetical protein n=1 Tax=Nocardioides alcanivorans TaxID=2897352 RepID=UPI001F3060FF|nr:hypothetical protein [Nocardioides alcanivorans]